MLNKSDEGGNPAARKRVRRRPWTNANKGDDGKEAWHTRVEAAKGKAKIAAVDVKNW